MLAEAVRLGCPHCLCSDALALPFPNRAFDIVTLITALEFIADPALALAGLALEATPRLPATMRP